MKFLYHWTDAGFFSEVNHMLLAALYCRSTGRELVLSSSCSPHFSPLGWQTFFKPFCEELDSRLLNAMDTRYEMPPPTFRGFTRRLRRELLVRIIGPLAYPDLELMSSGWQKLRGLLESPVEVAGEDASRRTLQDALRRVDMSIWRYNERTAQAVGKTIRDLDLPPRYTAIHIRRGDKAMEVPPVDEEVYVKRLEGLTDLQDVYIASDDSRCPERVQRLRPEWRVRSLCPKGQHGYFQREFGHMPLEERLAATQRVLAERDVLQAAELFVGSFSSGWGTYQGIARDSRTYAVDFEDWNFEGDEIAA